MFSSDTFIDACRLAAFRDRGRTVPRFGVLTMRFSKAEVIVSERNTRGRPWASGFPRFEEAGPPMTRVGQAEFELKRFSNFASAGMRARGSRPSL